MMDEVEILRMAKEEYHPPKFFLYTLFWIKAVSEQVCLLNRPFLYTPHTTANWLTSYPIRLSW